MKPMTQLERQVMQCLLSDPKDPIAALREQYESASIVRREFTGTGFFLYFSVPSEVRRLDRSISIKFGDVIAKINGLEFGAGFLLHVNDGTIDFLEGYSYEDPWPEEVNEFALAIDKGLTKAKELVLQNVLNHCP